MREAERVALIGLLGCTLAACARDSPELRSFTAAYNGPNEYWGSCGAFSKHPSSWTVVSAPPPNTKLLRSLADAAQSSGAKGGRYPIESWFNGQAGEVMWCRTETKPNESCTGEWWAFRKENDVWTVYDRNAWTCLL